MATCVPPFVPFGDVGMKADASLGGSAGGVVLDPMANEHLKPAVVHPGRDGDGKTAFGGSELLADALVEP